MPQIHDYRMIYHKVGDEQARFEASDMDPLGAGTVVAGHSFQFYGFLASNGAWIIQRFDTTNATSITAYRYAAGQEGYAAAWAGRDALTYDLFNTITII
jgi:hypothetical protein